MEHTVAVVIPMYRARGTILRVLGAIGSEIERIYAVDDCCPEHSGDYVERHCADPRVKVLRNHKNLGVGGATLAGYRAAAADGVAVIVKIDADGQMDPSLIPYFVRPILSGEADYTKGNRFFNAAALAAMPRVRLVGNAALSLVTKFSTGYWQLFDPANGFIAIHAKLVPLLPLDRLSSRFFFETDLLYHLGLLRAVVIDIPIVAYYGDEESNLKIRSIVFPFLAAHIARFFRRIALNYFLRDFSFASLCLLVGLPSLLFGIVFGAGNWLAHAMSGTATPTGTIMVAVLSVLLGIQLLLFFFSADIAATPRRPIHTLLDQGVIFPLEQFKSIGASSKKESRRVQDKDQGAHS